MKAYDIVVLGSGLVGNSFLLSLLSSSLEIAVIDKQVLFSKLEHCQDARAIALSHTSLETLKRLKVWPLLEKNATPIKEVHVTSKGKFGRTRLTAAHYQLTSLGTVLDADTLNYHLNEMVKNNKNLHYYQPDSIKKCTFMTDTEDSKWIIELSSGKKIMTKLLMGADGTNSFLRKKCGVEVSIRDYQQLAIVANVMLDQTHQNIAYERFLTGSDLVSLALLPFGENRMKSVLVATHSFSGSLMALEEIEYLKILQENFGFHLGRFKCIGKRYSYPLQQLAALTIYGPGWVLIGNASNTLHPVAAQGFNLGLRDADGLASVLKQAVHDEENIGHPSVLQRFAISRKKDHQYSQLFTETLLKEKKSLHWGIIASEFILPLKKRIIQQGLGANVS